VNYAGVPFNLNAAPVDTHDCALVTLTRSVSDPLASPPQEDRRDLPAHSEGDQDARASCRVISGNAGRRNGRRPDGNNVTAYLVTAHWRGWTSPLITCGRRGDMASNDGPLEHAGRRCAHAGRRQDQHRSSHAPWAFSLVVFSHMLVRFRLLLPPSAATSETPDDRHANPDYPLAPWPDSDAGDLGEAPAFPRAYGRRGPGSNSRSM
jgi:hypothetical protein